MNETRNGTADSRSHHGTNSFDVAVDTFYLAMKKIGGESIVTMTFNALTYDQILLSHLAERKGTRKNPRRPIDIYLFTLSNSKRDPEDKPAS
ncbi:hypothetical protein EJ110_NYTH17018 [Nymphaea thermarum]|nr:hypothetical protein EJ110_NYTH17018 [Nymphaea thermarum]